MSSITYGLGGYRPAHPSQGRVEERDDITATVTTWDDAGTVTDTRPYTAEEQAAADAEAVQRTAGTNRATIEDRAVTALAANATYLAIGSPSNAQNLAQIRLLTRECTGLIRLLLDQLDTTNGT